MKTRLRFTSELIALGLGLVTAFMMPMWAVDLAATKGLAGAAAYSNGLKNLGLGDMLRGIGVCGLLGVISALIVGLISYILILRFGKRGG